MTSRNISQGRYAGCFRGQHVRTKNLSSGKYVIDLDGIILEPLPNANVTWGILAAKNFGMMVTKITYLED